MNGKIIILLIALLGAAFYLQSSSVQILSVPNSTIQEWKQWKSEFGKRYSSPDVEAYRINIFYENVLHYEEVNSAQNEYTLGLTQFSDLTQQEFVDTYLGFKSQSQQEIAAVEEFVSDDVNADVDWRTQGAVTPVKNQGQCGSCWAFSTTGSLEGLHKIKQGTLESYSEQQLVDCSRLQGNQGCNGGLMDNAFKYVKAKGILLESEYPYTAKDGKCEKQGGAYKIGGYSDVGRGQVAALQKAVTQQPTSVAVDASNWSAYKGGVFSGCGTSLNHGVLAVGYTATAFLIKNSWGTSWGEQGYMQLKYGNTCGVANQASYPTA